MISNESFSKVKYYLLFLILVISFYRSPFIFLNGRFASEEATQHLLSALNNSFIGNFLFYDDLTVIIIFTKYFTRTIYIASFRTFSLRYSIWFILFHFLIPYFA